MNRIIDSRRAPSFPFLALPIEIRQEIYAYLLPHTGRRYVNNHVASALQELAERLQTTAPTNTIWTRGQTSLLAVSRQLHDECAALLYGTNTFVLFVTYEQISFRFRWLLPSRLAPSRNYDFLDLMPPKYLGLVRQIVVSVDHVDSYTGMIKYNVGGKGLTHGLRLQVETLVNALRPLEDNGKHSQGQEVHLNTIDVRLLNGNDHLDHEKKGIARIHEDKMRSVQEVQTVLEPLARLHGIAKVTIHGAVTREFAQHLRATMKQ